MDPASEALPDDVAALKAALVAERARLLEVAAELAVARAKASEDMALIAAQKLRIAKLERQVYGQRSERSARLIDQLALEFEELAASATEDELAAERAAPKTTTVRAFTRRRAERDTFPRPFAARAGGDRSADGLRVLRRQSPAQARRGRDADAGDDAAAVESDRDGAGEVLVSRLRKDQPGAGAVPCGPEGMGGPEPARDDRVREVRPAPASEPAGRPLCARGRADRALHHGRCRGRGFDGARSASAPDRGPCHGGRAPARRRHDRSGADQRQDRHRPALDLCPRRWAIRRRRAARRDLPLLARPARRASAGASRRLRRHPPGGCL